MISANRKSAAIRIVPVPQFDESELRGSVDRHEHVKLAFGGAHFGDVDMKIGDRIGFEFPLGGNLSIDLVDGRSILARGAVQRAFWTPTTFDFASVTSNTAAFARAAKSEAASFDR